MKNIVIEDLTMYFYDSIKNLQTRRKRIGIKSLMKQIFTKCMY
jgi:hypothetical protein